MIRKIVSIDLLASEYCATKDWGFPYFPLRQFVQYFRPDGVDIIEVLCTVQRRVPENDSPEAIAQVDMQFKNKRFALEMEGARVIECPAKRSLSSQTGFKQSDDQRLMIKTLTLAMKLRPDFVTLVAADGDYAPMVEALRDEGIRTEVVASPKMLASDLRRHAFAVVDMDEILQKLQVPHATIVQPASGHSQGESGLVNLSDEQADGHTGYLKNEHVISQGPASISEI